MIIPTYNERENVADVIQKVMGQPLNAEILVIDDNSPDGTADIVTDLCRDNSQLHLIQRPRKLGLGTAYIEGFKYALKHHFDYIFEMDADLSHDPNELPNFILAMERADLVIGSRYINGVNVVNWPLRRLLLSYFASAYTRFVTGVPIRDTTSGFKCFRRDVLKKIDLDKVRAGGYAFQVEMNWLVWTHGFRIREIPIIFVDRTVGQSKMSKAIVREAVLTVGRLWFKGLIFRLKGIFHRQSEKDS
ncbi:MAG: polyprenol monophosphomannose synthase [Candidatus Electryoneaceae bacterium]|nr:polyprenol monophosphomannose synthase [Candidatus Electryoneaceae bacterium]